jgi:hypothetical protein
MPGLSDERRWQGCREQFGFAQPAVVERCAFCSFEVLGETPSEGYARALPLHVLTPKQVLRPRLVELDATPDDRGPGFGRVGGRAAVAEEDSPRSLSLYDGIRIRHVRDRCGHVRSFVDGETVAMPVSILLGGLNAGAVVEILHLQGFRGTTTERMDYALES